MRAALLLPLLVCACANTWPAGSYIQTGDTADVGVLVPAVSDCLANIVPGTAPVSLAPAKDAMSSVLVDELQRAGRVIQPDGQAVSYVIAPLDAGEFIRVSAPYGACSQYFSRTSGTLKAAGPIMVIAR